MKISKVDHTRSAVAKNKGNIEGILYKDPTQGTPVENLSARFNKLNKTAKLLYNVFNQVQVGDMPKKPERGTEEILEKYEISKMNFDRRVRCSELINGTKDFRGLNSVLSSILFENVINDHGSKIKKVRSAEDIISRVKTCRNPRYNAEDIVECVTLYLRGSLKGSKDNVITFIMSLGKENISQDQKEQIVSFVKAVEKDFTKTDLSKKIEKSLKNQNLTIQPDKKAEFATPVAQSSTSRKKNEKNALNDFLTQFADLDENKRMDILRVLSRMVDLYFNAPEDEAGYTLPEAVHQEPDFNVWEAHESRKTNKGSFVSVSDKLQKATAESKKQDSLFLRTEFDGLREQIRRRNMWCYRFSLRVIQENKGLFFEDEGINRFWVHHIEDAVERILIRKKAEIGKLRIETLFKLNVGYLSEKVWKDIINFISIKYIALGKSVFNFGMEELFSGECNEMKLGIVDDRLKKGITSFDYEQIKAEETLQRETAVAIAFAANNLSRAVVNMDNVDSEEDNDFLLWKLENIKKYISGSSKEDGEILRAVLQFFGGKSRWSDMDFKAAYGNSDDYEERFLNDLKEMIYSLRNNSFHFVTVNEGKKDWNQELIGIMFEKDAESCITYEKNKFYSNNLPMFYSDQELNDLLNLLYAAYVPRASQVPSFNSVVVRKNFPVYLAQTLGCRQSFDPETILKWQNALYYVFKEIYYNIFLTSDSIKPLFEKALYSMPDDRETENGRAVGDFKRRYNEIKENKFAAICQIIMTEYNYQNSGNRKVKSAQDSKKNPDIFQHYKMLLLKCISEAFAAFIKGRKDLSFLVKPGISVKEMKAAEEFLPEWRSGLYAELINALKNNAELQKWYVACRFLNGKMLNHLSGIFSTYIQYIDDIKRRANATGNQLYKRNDSKKQINKIIEIIRICILLSGNISNDFTDYFADEEEYAKYLSDYLNLDETEGISYFTKLDMFCNSDGNNLGIYMDAQKPIVNRNVVMSKLFGPGPVLSRVVSHVSEKEIQEYFIQKDRITGYKVKGVCKNKDEQKAVLDFQKMKNRIEFATFVKYGELINDLLGQLINWSYLRERDLLYFQLGFHYICLKNDKAVKPDGYSLISTGSGLQINGAILYQIAAMYINGLGIYSLKDNEFKSGSMATGSKIGAFLSYSAELLKGSSLAEDKESIYNAGLEVFETINEHDNITDVRNIIDHFKYYTCKYGSILDLYSEVFDRFFTYDMKYQKNVVNMLTNILKEYFVIMIPEIGTGEKQVNGKNKSVKPRAQISIRDKGISSDEFTYKFEGGQLKTAAQDNDFLETVVRILYFPDAAPENKVLYNKSDKVETDSDKNESRSAYLGKKNGKDKNDRARKSKSGNEQPETYSSGGQFVNNPFADLLKNLKP